MRVGSHPSIDLHAQIEGALGRLLLLQGKAYFPFPLTRKRMLLELAQRHPCDQKGVSFGDDLQGLHNRLGVGIFPGEQEVVLRPSLQRLRLASARFFPASPVTRRS